MKENGKERQDEEDHLVNWKEEYKGKKERKKEGSNSNSW